MSESQPVPQPVELEIRLPKKEKKPRSEAQIATQQKALAALKAKREAKAEEQKKDKDAQVIAKEKWRQVKKAHPTEEIVTKKELEAAMSSVKEMLSKVGEQKPVVVEKEKIVEKPVERVVERIVERQAPVQIKKITGHELLDTLFFNK